MFNGSGSDLGLDRSFPKFIRIKSKNILEGVEGGV
jgi:hypothetical protein